LLPAKHLSKPTAGKNARLSPELPQGGDGIEPIGNGDYLVSSWPGYIFYVSKDGNTETLLETHAEKRNTADIGYDPVKRSCTCRPFLPKPVTAYKLD
jgi:hypothetical protein